jgi:hypothetical protein
MDWRKSTYSSVQSGACVETADDSGLILVRDTTDRVGVVLSVPEAAWKRFLTTIR